MTDEPLPRCEFVPDKLILSLDLRIGGDVKAIAPAVERITRT